jgi:hypothetical protein
MGLTLEFYLGNSDAIVRAVADIELDSLQDSNTVTHYADFSLHIIPADLDLLSESIGHVTARNPQGLRSSLEPILDEVDRGALSVAPDWVRYVAVLQSEQVPEVVELWASAMRSKHEDPEIVANDDMRQAVAELLDLCRCAAASDGNVVHVWFG